MSLSRAALVTASLLLAGPAPVAAVEYADLHPRLLFDPDVLASLPDSIAADPVKLHAWQAVEQDLLTLAYLAPSVVLDDNYGLTNLPHMALGVALADEPLASDCAAQLIEVAEHLIASESPGSGPDDHATALRLRALLVCYDNGYAAASPAELQRVLVEIRGYLELMTTDFEFTRGVHNPYCSNHSLAVGAALLLAELCLDEDLPQDPLLARAVALGDSLIDKGLGDLLGEDGSYAEGGLYQAYVHRMLIPVWDAAHRLRGLQLWDPARVRGSLEWTAYLLAARGGGYFLNRNDCSETTRPLSRHNSLWEWSQAFGPDPDFARWVQYSVTGENGYSFGTNSDQLAVILWHRRGPLRSPQSFLDSQRLFPDTGLYVYRAGWPGLGADESFHFTIQASEFKGGHWQEDVGQFTFEAFGYEFAMDNGPGLPAKETEGHNLPLVDGIGQHNAGGSIGTDGKFSLLLDAGFCRAMLAEVRSAYAGHSPFNNQDYPYPGTDWSWGYDDGNPLTRADRWVLLFPRPPDELPTFYLLDDLEKGGERMTVEWRQHFKQTVGLSVSGTDYDYVCANGRVAGKLIAPPPEETAWTIDSFNNGGPDEETRLLSITHASEQARFLWQMMPILPGQPELPLVIERFAGGARATLGGEPQLRRDLVAAWAPTLDEPGLHLVGRFGVREEEAGAVRTAIVEGKQWRLDDTLLFDLSPTASASVDGAAVYLSKSGIDFEIYAPEAVEVIAAGQSIPFVRIGDYIFSSTHTALPGAAGGDGAARNAWTLRVVGGSPGEGEMLLAVTGPGSGGARVEIFDVNGRRVGVLHDGPLPAGRAELLWRGSDALGRRLPSGVYLARLSADGASARRKLLLLR